MVVTHEIKSRADIEAEIRFRFVNRAQYCLKRNFNPNIVENLLKGKTSTSSNSEIVAKINADTGADMKAWEK